MAAGPPVVIEAVIAAALPPAAREHVLGDLRERFSTTPQYVADAARVVPRVVWSQVRRRADPLLVVVQASFLWVVIRPDTPTDSVSAALKYIIPLVAALLGLIAAEVYSTPCQAADGDLDLAFDLALRKAAVAGLIAACAFLFSEQVLRSLPLGPEWLLPRPMLVKGSLGGFLMLLPLNISWEMLVRTSSPAPRPAPDQSLTADVIQMKARHLQRRHWGLAVWAWLGVHAVRAGWQLVRAPQTAASLRMAGFAILAAAGYATYGLCRELRNSKRWRTAGTIPAYRAALEDHRDAFRRSWLRYVVPFVAAQCALLLQSAIDHPQWWWPYVAQMLNAIVIALILRQVSLRWIAVLQRDIDVLGR
jgi:hypothetical protein